MSGPKAALRLWTPAWCGVIWQLALSVVALEVSPMPSPNAIVLSASAIGAPPSGSVSWAKPETASW